jgi:hypothetical protein
LLCLCLLLTNKQPLPHDFADIAPHSFNNPTTSLPTFWLPPQAYTTHADVMFP